MLNIAGEFERLIKCSIPPKEQDIMLEFTENMKYLPVAICVILLYDITNSASLQFIKEAGYPVSMREMNTYGFLYLVGTKFDKQNSRQVYFDVVIIYIYIYI